VSVSYLPVFFLQLLSLDLLLVVVGRIQIKTHPTPGRFAYLVSNKY